MRKLALALLASALAVAATDAVWADNLQVTPNKQNKYQQQQPNYSNYSTMHGRSVTSNSLPDPGSSNRYFSNSVGFRNYQGSQGPAFTQNGGGWTALPCTQDVFGCF